MPEKDLNLAVRPDGVVVQDKPEPAFTFPKPLTYTEEQPYTYPEPKDREQPRSPLNGDRRADVNKDPVCPSGNDPAVSTERIGTDGKVTQRGTIRDDPENRGRARAKGWTIVDEKQ